MFFFYVIKSITQKTKQTIKTKRDGFWMQKEQTKAKTNKKDCKIKQRTHNLLMFLFNFRANYCQRERKRLFFGMINDRKQNWLVHFMTVRLFLFQFWCFVRLWCKIKSCYDNFALFHETSTNVIYMMNGKIIRYDSG